jgi:hypothetical protein
MFREAGVAFSGHRAGRYKPVIIVIIVAFELGSQAMAADAELRDNTSNIAADCDKFIKITTL